MRMPKELSLVSFGRMIDSNHLAGVDNRPLADDALKSMQKIFQDTFYLLIVLVAYEISTFDFSAD